MNFREFYLNEARTYILMKDQHGPKTRQELPQAAQQAYTIRNGNLYLPPKLEKDKENILHAHYARMGSNPQDHAQWKKYRQTLDEPTQKEMPTRVR